MKKKKIFVRLAVFALIGIMTFALPTVALAQETNPPQEEETQVGDTPENDILVFEPQFYWELPLSQGFKISFNFGISFEVPRELTLISDQAFNLFLRFSSYIREDALQPTPTPTPEITPAPTPTPEP